MTAGLLELLGRAKLQSNYHHQQTNTQLFTGRMPFLSPNQQCQSTEGKLLDPYIRNEDTGTPLDGWMVQCFDPIGSVMGRTSDL